jgi:hypothetical protein
VNCLLKNRKNVSFLCLERGGDGGGGVVGGGGGERGKVDLQEGNTEEKNTV